jgi:hypothetical protein
VTPYRRYTVSDNDDRTLDCRYGTAANGSSRCNEGLTVIKLNKDENGERHTSCIGSVAHVWEYKTKAKFRGDGVDDFHLRLIMRMTRDVITMAMTLGVGGL